MIERQIDENWTFRQGNDSLQGKATVPGTIHTDLFSEGIIEDPFYRTNEKGLQWIDKEDWEYATMLTISTNEFQKENLVLNFKGLDTYADVYLNDHLILNANNMFRDWEVDIKPFAIAGDNDLKIYFHSPIQKGLELLEAEGHAYPASNDQSENGGLGNKKVSIFTRKAGYHYGWDWGPRFVTSGIWRPVVLKAWDDARIQNPYIIQKSVNTELADLEAQVSVEANSKGSGKISVKNTSDGIEILSKEVELKQGINQFTFPFTIKNPRLWWSNGLGEPNMYDFTFELSLNGKVVASKEVTTGLRSLKLVREKDDMGESFLFELNGIPVFAKGANYIPNDNFLPRVSNASYEKVIADAVDANMNMLRVWGGGIYENDYFYELCDKNGIMVWEDFMFACSMYPGDEAFLENVKQEAIDNVVRLRNHPSIALWCGNNEINTAWVGWGWKQRYTPELQEKIFDSYLKLFHELLPEVVNEYTYNTDYWPSSPQAGYEADQHAGYGTTSGDMHYWGVWHGLHPFEDFEVYRSRFMSEYGFQSFPEFETVQSYALPEDYDIESEVMAAHQRSGIGNLRIKEYMTWYFNVPDNFEDFLYMSHVLQAYGMRKGMEAHRRAMPFCMGSLYWQINDCWPVASWSSTDYYHKWKAMHYEVKRAYEKTILSATHKDDAIEIYGITDELKPVEGTLKMQLLKTDGTLIKEKDLEVTLKENTSTLLYKGDEWLTGIDTTNTVLNCKLVANDKVHTKNNFYFCKPKDLKLMQAEFKYTLNTEGEKVYIEIESDQLCRFVFLNFADQNEFFTDNYFELEPGVKKRIEVRNVDLSGKPELQIKHLQMMQ